MFNYLRSVRPFLAERYGTGPMRLDKLDADQVTSFVLRHARDGSPGGAQLMTTGLRSLLRYLWLHGQITSDLAACVPTVPSWRLTRIPISLNLQDVRRLLEACDQHTAVGRRDRAVLLLLARLGLRASEVATLMLDDVDWMAGEITIPGKGARRDKLPLPSDVGAALAAYARRDRPRCGTRRFFLRARAPHQGFSSFVAVSDIVARALGRAGLHPRQRGAHLLRHTAATQMLRRGASLAEIGDVLRHRRPDTTAIYAKVDLITLRAIAPHWPRGVR